MAITRTTISLPDDLVEQVRALAEDQGISLVDAYRLLIRTGLKLANYEREGVEIVVREKDEPETRVLIVW